MSSYDEQLNAIRAARAERDKARADLHEQLLQQLELQRAQRKADRKELAASPATLAAIAALRDRISEDSEKLRAVETELRAIEQLQEDLKTAQARLAALTSELDRLQQELAHVDVALNAPDLTPERRAQLEAERDALRAKIEALKEQVAELKEQVAELERRLHQALGRKQQLEHQRDQLEAEIKRSQAELAQLAESAQGHDDRSDDIDNGRQRISDGKAVLTAKEEAVGALLDNLFRDLTPQTLIEQWNDATPIMLLPLRLETRFKETDSGEQLWVRVFPDEVAVTTHEKILTDRERDFGVAYWKSLRGATDEDKRKDAWRALADKFGANRAAWVALQTRPLNWSAPPPASDDDLQFPDIKVTKPDNWTEAPHSLVMPDRFVLMAYRGGQVIQTLVGKQINDRLVLGPAPLQDENKPSITRDPADNRLKYSDDFRWLTEFPLAVENGMAFRVPLAAADSENGFDQLLVIGVKLSANETDGQKLIEDLIDNHHYSAKGFSLVKQGSATNNTANEESHFSSSDWLHDVSYFVETGNPLFTWEADPNTATDGQRLAEYLGINYEPLQYVSNADATDNCEAVAMNRALYAGTLGYFLHSMLNEVLSDDDTKKLRELFTNFVTGRGPIPAIRVGNQPYGILLTSSFSKWAYPQFTIRRLPIFDDQVRNILLHLEGLWRNFKSQLGHISKSGNASANLMNVLGLQPTSADYYHRVGYSYDYLKNLEQFQLGGNYFGDVLMAMFEGFTGRQFLKNFGYTTQRDDGTPKPMPLLFQLVYQHYHSRLNNQNLIDSLPLSEERKIKPYNEGTGKNYIDWLLDNSANVDKLEREDFGASVTKPNALLYMMLHNALLAEARHSIYSLLRSHDIVADELVRSRKFMNMSSQPDVSHWEVFRAPANRVLAGEPSDRSLLSFVQLDRFNAGPDLEIGRYINDAKNALKILAGLPTARLERLLAEHIDALNYRLDAWQTALFDRRVRQQRELSSDTQKRRTGIYLGSYGYLENVRAARDKWTKLPEDVLPPELREGNDNLYRNPQNGGYVHTPSLNHATAAAILRNGYLTHSSPADREKLSVNLSSERVRRARYLIEGVRNGQLLEALLGYLFERGLHDWTTRTVNPIILDQLKPVFRKGFPIKRTRIPRQGFDSEPAEVIEDYSVVNGLDLARTTAAFPYGVADMPPLSNDQINAIKTEKSNLENSLDALRDVLTAECAYQLALGNFDRAAAVMQAISGGQLPVEIEVVNSSRGTDLSFTNRVALQFATTVTANPWPPIPMTRRARTEPAFNNWIGGMLGDPATIRCSVRAVDENSATLLDGGGNPIEDLVSLADLSVQPLDFIYLIRKKVEATGYSEIESRVRYHFARKFALSDATIVKIEFANSGGGGLAVRSFGEVLSFANAIREVAGKARPLQAQDFAPASKTVTAASENPGNLDVVELQSRVAGLRLDFDTLFTDLDNAASDADTLQTDAAVDTLRARLVAIADAGVPLAFPLSSLGSADAERESLLAQSKSLHDRYEVLKPAYDQNLTTVDAAATKPPQKVTLLTQMARGFLGDDFVLLPKFNLTDPADVTKADANRGQLLKYARETKLMPLPVDEWLHGVSLVRPNMRTFATMFMLGQTFNGDVPACSPMQLPFRGNDSWLGVEFPEATAIVHDTISMVQCLPQGFQPAASQSGLLVDEWTETLPQKNEVTGLAFNFDQPNSAPPSAILLAVTPELTGKWHWDDLAATVLDTIERAKLRAVEPDMIDSLSGFGALLPSILSEFHTSPSGISLDYLLNLDFVAGMVASMTTRTLNG
jgi:predicted  nucleic acid-binding Zn-ribbon protein